MSSCWFDFWDLLVHLDISFPEILSMSKQACVPPNCTGRKISANPFNQRTMQPMPPRPRRVTTMTARVRPTQPSSSIRHSSPKFDRRHDAPDLLLSDSVASAITSTSACGNPVRRRSLSSGSLASTSVSPSTKTPVRCDQSDILSLRQAVLTEWAMVHQRLSELTTAQKESELNRVKQLLTNCEEKLEELRAVRKAHAELTNFLRVTKALEAENSLLLSLISLLRPTAALGTASFDSTPSNPSVLDLLKKLTLEVLKPNYERLPLREFTLTDDVHEVVFPHVHQFVMHSEHELQKLEELATVIEETADRLETTTVPLAKSQAEQVIEASQLLANEASLRFERLQRMWLQSCSA
ncbi:hypothetical protein CSKR_103762 [Clonorchis sinensis]|uniref:Uncharacterized protein n=1 Tax=Clonorchis sinensis TaxID=79923 RepID=A0A3R7FRC2_CLOSI|nr:hypothetical protein CSKR_103762 [Clonorchis sinensis]